MDTQRQRIPVHLIEGAHLASYGPRRQSSMPKRRLQCATGWQPRSRALARSRSRRMGSRQHCGKEHAYRRGCRRGRICFSGSHAGAGITSGSIRRKSGSQSDEVCITTWIGGGPRSFIERNTTGRRRASRMRPTTALASVSRAQGRTCRQECPHDCRAASLPQQRASRICRSTGLPRMRTKAFRSSPSSLHATAGARPESER